MIPLATSEICISRFGRYFVPSRAIAKAFSLTSDLLIRDLLIPGLAGTVVRGQGRGNEKEHPQEDAIIDIVKEDEVRHSADQATGHDEECHEPPLATLGDGRVAPDADERRKNHGQQGEQADNAAIDHGRDEAVVEMSEDQPGLLHQRPAVLYTIAEPELFAYQLRRVIPHLEQIGRAHV